MTGKPWHSQSTAVGSTRCEWQRSQPSGLLCRPISRCGRSAAMPPGPPQGPPPPSAPPQSHSRPRFWGTNPPCLHGTDRRKRSSRPIVAAAQAMTTCWTGPSARPGLPSKAPLHMAMHSVETGTNGGMPHRRARHAVALCCDPTAQTRPLTLGGRKREEVFGQGFCEETRALRRHSLHLKASKRHAAGAACRAVPACCELGSCGG